jgi:hypothetical protein
MLAPAVLSVMVTDCAEVNDPPAGEMSGVATVVWTGVDVAPPPPPQPASRAAHPKASQRRKSVILGRFVRENMDISSFSRKWE